LAISIEQNHPAKGGAILRILSRPGREEMTKDGLKMGCENAKLFLSEPLAQEFNSGHLTVPLSSNKTNDQP
jgi:hypothetical protein